MKKLLPFVLAISALCLAGCSESESERLERLDQELSKLTLSEYQTRSDSENMKEMFAAYMTLNKLPKEVESGMNSCVGEYAYTKSKELKLRDVMGWCRDEYQRGDVNFAKHVNLQPFFSKFSAWDGAYYPLEDVIKKTINDPNSYEHEETRYSLVLHSKEEGFEPYAQVKTNFRAKNGFGGVVRAWVFVKVDLKTLRMTLIDSQGF